MSKDKNRVTACSLMAAVLFQSAVFAAGERLPLSSLVVPRGEDVRNPTTEIAVGFGDVRHLSPWRIKRRFPRNGGVRGGQPVMLRDALLAISEVVAKDEEMPEHTFAFDADGTLASVCDVPLAKTVVLADGVEKTVSAAMLDHPVRDFGKVEFRKADVARQGGSAPGAENGGRKTGDVKTVTLPGGAKMEMIWCGSGSFMMGSPRGEVGRFEDEQLHPVRLTRGFWLGKYEVTQAQWECVMGENHSRFKGRNLPVENVSWEDCRNFIEKVNSTLGGCARFPTEAEWEYACRAGSDAAVAGSGYLHDMAWYDDNSDNQTHEVGRNKPNAWGFYDMHGNVLEWCYDWFSNSEMQSVDPKGPPSGSFRVLRGGCWFFYARDCRSAYRLKRDPGIRNCIYGFRLACSEK